MREFLFTILFGILFTLLGSWVFYLYWGWYVVPVFGHPITYRQAIGIDMTISLELVGVVVAIICRNKDAFSLYAAFAYGLAYCLASGFLWHLFL